jgi:phosphoglycolate phosphatase-like HAD superfamily hydrolase
VTPSILGPAPIVDFDGTLACLPVPWDDLRARLDVERIGNLWDSETSDAWSTVRDAEIEAAGQAVPFEPVRADLERAATFAVLTSNSEDAVAHFLARFTSLESRLAVIVGRETLAGPKHDYDVFRRGYMRCVTATATVRGDEGVVYVGDADWELDFARRLGAHAIDVSELNTGS